MTGTLAQEQETYALDPSPAYVEVEPSTPYEPILAACEIDAEHTAKWRQDLRRAKGGSCRRPAR